MYVRVTIGAIFIIFILCAYCDNAVNYNEIEDIYVPSAPQNLSAPQVTAEEIRLSWAPPTSYTKLTLPPREPTKPDAKPQDAPKKADKKMETQSDEPTNDVIEDSKDIISGVPERAKDLYYAAFKDWYKNDKLKYDNEFASDVLMDAPYRTKRSGHRHRKRRQDSNSTDVKPHEKAEINAVATEVVKKIPPHKDPLQVAYVLYYEQGVPRYDLSPVIGVPNSAEVKKKNVFPSDLGMEDYSKATKNLTLLNTAGVLTKVVGFRLKRLKPFTPYKIWVRAFYNFSLDGVQSSDLLDRLGPSTDPLYVLTDVLPPSAPKILNLTCDQPNGMLYLQWRQPQEYNNSLDKYVVTLRKIPELQPRTTLSMPTNKNDIEMTISVPVELWNMSLYEVKVFAVTLSVASSRATFNGKESEPQQVSSELCAAQWAAMAPEAAPAHVSARALLAALPVALLAATLLLVYWRCKSRVSKCISAAYNYLEEGGERAARAPLNVYKKPVGNNTMSPAIAAGAPLSVGARPPRMAGRARPPVAKNQFPQHVAQLHADGDIGFSKEYEIVVTKSAALGHTSHYSHRPENRLKNRYLNITAYDHSRVCVSSGGRCGAAGCAGGAAGGGTGGGAGGAACDYVNANFIDGMLPKLLPVHLNRIKHKLQGKKSARQSSTKPQKPPPQLAEGIESAFLNIEFSGIVESDDNNSDSDSDRSDNETELDDVFVEIDNAPTRVKLEWLVWKRRYIATQGPTPNTLDAFWRMICQHKVHTLVMITNLVERGRRKCDMYWPSGGRGSSATYGNVHVTLLHEDVRALYTVRHLKVIQQDTESPSSPSTIIQYHYTVWPDHGTPRHPLAVLPFVKAASDDNGTVLVHCSAGVGRTGTYIVLDAQLNQLKLTGTLSPLGFLCRARTQRNHLVQTEEQYIFVHDALLEHVRSGNTDVEFHKAREYLVKLLQDITEEELAVLDLNTNKNKSVNDLNAGENETSSVKTTDKELTDRDVSEKEILENGSQISIKTDDLNDMNSDISKSSKDLQDESKEVVVNGNSEESEGVYDLAPRSTDTYSKKMQAYNNMSEEEKEEIRRANRVENYAILERMRSLSNRHQMYQGPPPVNLLEKQFLLITRSCAEASASAHSAYNCDKNRPGAALPSDVARVMLVPKPGLEGSEYINASWVCGRRRVREYSVCSHPAGTDGTGDNGTVGGNGTGGPRADVWRMLWDHTAQLVLLLDADHPECEEFWPTEDDRELFIANFKASFVSKDTYVAYRKCDRTQAEESPKPPAEAETPAEPETNGYRRQESDCADDERLIPENGSPVADTEPSYRFDRTELRLERLSNRDLSARKSIANGDLFSSLSEKKNGPKSPRSPSKMSLKNFRLSSPTKFKFPDWGSRAAGSPPETAPPPPPVAPSLSVEEEAELRRPCYYFEKVDSVPESIPSDRVIEVINVSVHSLQDDYQLSVKFIKCNGWLVGDTTDYVAGKPEDNECVKAIRNASSDSDRQEAVDRLIEPFKDSFALIEFVAGSQMEYKNGPVVVVDKDGGWKAMSFCTLSAACGGAGSRSSGSTVARAERVASLYTCAALAAHARAGHNVHSHSALLAMYAALANYGSMPALQPEEDDDR